MILCILIAKVRNYILNFFTRISHRILWLLRERKQVKVPKGSQGAESIPMAKGLSWGRKHVKGSKARQLAKIMSKGRRHIRTYKITF
jgi:hypothetical protein